MIQKFYVLAWLLLAGSILYSVIAGPVNGLQMVAFSLIGLALVYAFALWAVLANTRDAEHE